ncbi:nucleoside hydrolase [Rhodovulum sp. MB263]|uniref:nucleoside hydrolase n=1 Tax=Rhodovulum sp. (strain MB263) TaxID=308754 RepID=UPI0009B7C69C|nr:nucleoside hydrolase [Rhodovulum sp. MB263]ARC90150.1 nucleoside hydrolase [Rhodovulum sp. MB263]
MNRIPVIIDTDPGVDDAAAILMALGSPELDVLGISAVAGNVTLSAALTNACRIVGLTGRTDLPVMAGARAPLLRDQVFGKYAAIGAFPAPLIGAAPVAPATENAVRFIARKTRAAARAGEPLTICAIGPLTNIALALRMHPEVGRGIRRIVCMGGAIAMPGHRTPWAEFNIHADPHAAEIVFGSGVPLVLFPLDVTTQALFTDTHIAEFRARGGAAGRALANLLTQYDRSAPERYGRPGGPLHDPMTIAWLVQPDLFKGRSARIGVQVGGATSGHTFADFNAPSPHMAVMTGVDEAAYIALVLDRIAAHGERRGTTPQKETE